MTNIAAAQYLRVSTERQEYSSIVRGLLITQRKTVSRYLKPTRPSAAWKLEEGQDCLDCFRMSLGASHSTKRLLCMCNRQKASTCTLL
jgi:hypothetical protein